MKDDLGGSGDVGGLVGPKCQLVQSHCICMEQKLAPEKVVQEIPILSRNGPVNILWKMLHCFLVNEVTGIGNLKLGYHIVEYAV